MSRCALSASVVVSLALVAAFIVPPPVDAGLERTCTAEDAYRNKQGNLCGPALNSMLRFICGSAGFNKRGGLPDKTALLIGAADFDVVDGSSMGAGSVSAVEGGGGAAAVAARGERSGIFLPQSAAASFLHSKRQYGGADGRQGITCECCVYQCAISELQQYCRSP